MKDIPVWAQILIIAGVIIGATVAGQFMLLNPQQDTIRIQDERLTKLRAENNKAAAIEQRLPELEAEVKRLDEQLSVLVQILPKAVETDVIVSKIKNVADNYHLHIMNMTPKAPAAKGVYSEFAITFNVRGTYHSLALFFDKISKMELIISVGDLGLKRAGKDLVATVDAQFTAVTYVYGGN